MPSEITALLSDTSLTWTERRTRLQGWSGPGPLCGAPTAGQHRASWPPCELPVTPTRSPTT
jgi:hypothetical protein